MMPANPYEVTTDQPGDSNNFPKHHSIHTTSRHRAIIAAFACFVMPIAVAWLLPIVFAYSGDLIVTRRIDEEARRGHFAAVSFLLIAAVLILSQAIGWAILLRAGIWKYVPVTLTIIFGFLSVFGLIGLGVFALAFFQTLLNR